MRRGFTLIEMLVATALVLLIMVMFANVFGEAVKTIRSSRGLINNDGKARSVTDTLRRDLSRAMYRTSVARGASVFIAQGTIQESPRGIVALAPGDRPDPRQQGFLCFSENDPHDGGDDVLHLTVSVGETLRDPLVSDPALALYQGRAANISGDPNQPDGDDGVLGNGAATSRFAEVCYFLRGTTLYRRVQLLRDPLPSASPPFGTQPTAGATGTGAPLLVNPPTFYHDFDFAASNINGQIHLHGRESLDNTLGLTNSPLAVPGNRFGHRTNGQPREFDDAAVPAFFGRFTQQETADVEFGWPGLPANPADSAALQLDTAGQFLRETGIPAVFDNSEIAHSHDRDGEDILLTGVEGFNIEVWDTGYAEGDFNGSGAWDAFNPVDDLNQNGFQEQGAWVDLGHNIGQGTAIGPGLGMFGETWNAAYNIGNATWSRRNAAYGPGGPTGNHVFDTWHPSLGPTLGAPPYQPLQRAPNALNWTSGTAPAATDVFFPDRTNGNFSIGFVPIASTGTGLTGAREPEWPREPGVLVQDGGVTWQCFDNRIGLERIRITIRFRDPGSNLPRQVSIVHSFVE